MMEFGLDLTPWLTATNVWLVVKLMYIVAFVVYLLFTVVVFSQIRNMTATLNGQLDLPLKTLGMIYVVVALLALIAALVIL